MAFVFYRPYVRTFETENPMQEGQQLHLRPPLLETVRRLDTAVEFDEVVAVACAILSRNTEDITITAAELRTNVDYDQLRAFLKAFRGWLVGQRDSDPN